MRRRGVPSQVIKGRKPAGRLRRPFPQNAKSGRASYDGVQATLVLTDGTRKGSKQTMTEGRCAPGS
jgi:hypothetical protein